MEGRQTNIYTVLLQTRCFFLLYKLFMFSLCHLDLHLCQVFSKAIKLIVCHDHLDLESVFVVVGKSSYEGSEECFGFNIEGCINSGEVYVSGNGGYEGDSIHKQGIHTKIYILVGVKTFIWDSTMSSLVTMYGGRRGGLAIEARSTWSKDIFCNYDIFPGDPTIFEEACLDYVEEVFGNWLSNGHLQLTCCGGYADVQGGVLGLLILCGADGEDNSRVIIYIGVLYTSVGQGKALDGSITLVDSKDIIGAGVHGGLQFAGYKAKGKHVDNTFWIVPYNTKDRQIIYLVGGHTPS